VNESFTAAIVARSLLAALRSSWVVGVLVGWVVVRRELFWPVSGDVVVAVDIWSPKVWVGVAKHARPTFLERTAETPVQNRTPIAVVTNIVAT
jgi:hypothetical protein